MEASGDEHSGVSEAKEIVRVLDLFSGIGGFSLGLERAGMETVAFCETDEFCRKVLAKHWPDVPCYSDIRKLTGDIIEQEVGPIDLISGGFPCQPFSQAGKRQGVADDRYLWPEMLRVIREVRPRWVLGENVAGIVKMALDQVLADLESLGYTCQSFIVPACAVDAPHQRKRVWIVAALDDANTDWKRSHRASINKQRETESTDRQERIARPVREVLADGGSAGERGARDVANAPRLQSGWQEQRPQRERTGETSQSEFALANRWLPEPNVGRVAHGVPQRVDRLRSLGNAVVPQVVEQIGRMIIDAE